MCFITKFLSFVDFAVENGFEFLSGDRENDIDVLEFQLGFGHVDLIFSVGCFLLQLFDFFLGLEVLNHFAEVSEEGPGVIVGVSFFGGDLALIVFLLLAAFGLLRLRFLLQVPHVESFQHWGQKPFDLTNEGRDGFSFRIEEENASEILKKTDEVFVEYFRGLLLVAAPVFLRELSFEQFDELRFQENFVQRNQNLYYHQHDFAQRVSEPHPVFYF